jgi:acetamidase/formamidase
MTVKTLKASTSTCHWGFFDASLSPAVTIESGDEIIIDTISGGPMNLPGAGFHVPPELLEMHAQGVPSMPGHLLTGPVGISGAKAGDVLKVDILNVSLRQDWGFNFLGPLKGTLPHDFPNVQHTIIPLDAERGVGTLPWGLELELAPFFGVMGVAPPAEWGRISTIEPRMHGGNIDNKELVAGATLYLPIFVDGALFSCGDGHGAQGDGEVCVTAIETALQGHFRLTVLKKHDLTYPRAETPTHYITMGMAPDLGRCVEMALRDMIDLVSKNAKISREDAYMLCSLAGDLRITQTVNREKGVHMMMEKRLIDQR